jgi:hypothetical protein
MYTADGREPSAANHTPFPQCSSEIVKLWRVLEKNDRAGGNVPLRVLLFAVRRGPPEPPTPPNKEKPGPRPPQTYRPLYPCFPDLQLRRAISAVCIGSGT